MCSSDLMTSVTQHADLAACLAALGPRPLYALTTRAHRSVYDVAFAEGDALLFGPETRGLPDEVLETIPADARLKLPMRAGNRSLNLSNAAAVTVFEAWRQQGFRGSAAIR